MQLKKLESLLRKKQPDWLLREPGLKKRLNKLESKPRKLRGRLGQREPLKRPRPSDWLRRLRLKDSRRRRRWQGLPQSKRLHRLQKRLALLRLPESRLRSK